MIEYCNQNVGFLTSLYSISSIFLIVLTAYYLEKTINANVKVGMFDKRFEVYNVLDKYLCQVSLINDMMKTNYYYLDAFRSACVIQYSKEWYMLCDISSLLLKRRSLSVKNSEQIGKIDEDIKKLMIEFNLHYWKNISEDMIVLRRVKYLYPEESKTAIDALIDAWVKFFYTLFSGEGLEPSNNNIELKEKFDSLKKIQQVIEKKGILRRMEQKLAVSSL